jgi:hypothetical protein
MMDNVRRLRYALRVEESPTCVARETTSKETTRGAHAGDHSSMERVLAESVVDT